MGAERRRFHALMAPDPAAWPVDEVEKALAESASGPVCFGHMQEWSDWFPYLLHASIGHVGRWHPVSVFEGLVTNMMVHCPDRDACRHGEDFVEDALLTVGRLPMDARFWAGGRMIEGSAFQPVQRWPVGTVVADGGDLHAAFWLMAKYLSPDRLEEWLRSVMAIEDPAWGCGVLSWLACAEPVFEEPARWPGSRGDMPGFWISAHLLEGGIASGVDDTNLDCGPFLDPARAVALLSAVSRTLDPQRLDAWCRGLTQRKTSWGTLADIVGEADRLRTAVLRRHRPS